MPKHDKTGESDAVNDAGVAGTCIVCGKKADRMITNERYPGRHICITCFNGFAFNIRTLEEELAPLVDDLTEALGRLDSETK
jgi:hypothetical protein